MRQWFQVRPKRVGKIIFMLKEGGGKKKVAKKGWYWLVKEGNVIKKVVDVRVETVRRGD